MEPVGDQLSMSEPEESGAEESGFPVFSEPSSGSEDDDLGASGNMFQAVNQDDLEHDINKKADRMLLVKDRELDEKRYEKTQKLYDKWAAHVNKLKRNLEQNTGQRKLKLSERRKITEEIKWYEEDELLPLIEDLKQIKNRLEETNRALSGEGDDAEEGEDRLPGETERDYLIRKGKITAFGNSSGFHQEHVSESVENKSHTRLVEPGFALTYLGGAAQRNQQQEPVKNVEGNDVETEVNSINTEAVEDELTSDKALSASASEADNAELESDYEPEDELYNAEDDVEFDDKVDVEDLSEDSSLGVAVSKEIEEESKIDDGDETIYQSRLKKWCAWRSALPGAENRSTNTNEEWFKPHPLVPDAVLNDLFRLPGDIYPSLFDYQKTCVQWLWELYQQKTGGIIGDEMGLGKTVQIISFITGLHYSGLLEKPVLVVVPATVMNQWVKEFHRWWPPLRCCILHSIGSGMNSKTFDEAKLEMMLEMEDEDNLSSKRALNAIKSKLNAERIVDNVMKNGHVLITTYVGLRIYSDQILTRDWGYVVLDEGHKIRNPNLAITICCKQIKTYNRIILSGTPIQNNLLELWSLFDFVFPGRLGTLPVFEQQFAIPINMGGYANASNVQVQTGYKCAVILRDLISPYLLRRLKKDVAKDLPKKEEMVLFIKLTKFQQDMYELFLASEELQAIYKGRRNVLMGVDILRKICNHPDLVNRDIRKKAYGYYKKSGKMVVLKDLLALWRSQGHKTLLFCQTKQMLDILGKFVSDSLVFDPSMSYLRMDGSTPIAKRQQLVDQFNNTPSITLFLLTTKVGGLGVNLTGADRVIIYDPDWNPSTDIQARERAWRLGQTKDITIYRFMATGSIEEKIYHRQIFKTFLTNKILKDPKQKRFFKLNDLHDLFTLGDQSVRGTETGDLFLNKSKEVQYDKTATKSRKSNRLFGTDGKIIESNGDDFMEVAKIGGVSRLDEYEGEPDQNGEGQDNDDGDDNRIMQGIFSQNGVHSSIKHDDIVDSTILNQEISLVEREANKIANLAADALKRSRRLTQRNSEIGTPTWTGRFGKAGKITKKNVTKGRLGNANNLSSQLILAGLKERSNNSRLLNLRSSTLDGGVSSGVEDKEKLVGRIVDYLKGLEGHFSKSQDIINGLKLKLKDDQEMILMRALLRQISNWDSERKGWALKAEFMG